MSVRKLKAVKLPLMMETHKQMRGAANAGERLRGEDLLPQIEIRKLSLRAAAAAVQVNRWRVCPLLSLLHKITSDSPPSPFCHSLHL